MSTQKGPFFRPGQTIVLREIWRGRVWSARPVIVVQDRPDLTALYAPLGTTFKLPKMPDGKRVGAGNRLHSEWILKEEQIGYYSMRQTLPGADYSVLIFWDPPDMKQHSW
jgi:hypothetical protein